MHIEHLDFSGSDRHRHVLSLVGKVQTGWRGVILDTCIYALIQRETIKLIKVFMQKDATIHKIIEW